MFCEGMQRFVVLAMNIFLWFSCILMVCPASAKCDCDCRDKLEFHINGERYETDVKVYIKTPQNVDFKFWQTDGRLTKEAYEKSHTCETEGGFITCVASINITGARDIKTVQCKVKWEIKNCTPYDIFGSSTCDLISTVPITTSTSTSTTTTTSAPATTTTITSTSTSTPTTTTITSTSTSTPTTTSAPATLISRHKTRSSSRKVLTPVVTTSSTNDSQTSRHNGTTDTVEKEVRTRSICEEFPRICFLLISILIACGMPCGVFCVVGAICANYDRCKERFGSQNIQTDDVETHVANQALVVAQDAATAAKVKTDVAVTLTGTGTTRRNVIGLASSINAGGLPNLTTTGDPRTSQGAHRAALDAGREEMRRQRREARRNMRQNKGVPSAISNRARSGKRNEGGSSTRRHQVAASRPARDEALAQPMRIQKSEP